MTKTKKQIKSNSINQTNKNNKQNILLPYLRDYINQTSKDWNYITPYDFYHQYMLTNKIKDIYLLDIRKKSEYDKFHIKGAHNIFWLDLLKYHNLQKLPKDKSIFLICYVGHTSSQAMTLLKLLGYHVVSIKFGYGKSPAFEVPIAGWLNYNYPTIIH